MEEITQGMTGQQVAELILRNDNEANELRNFETSKTYKAFQKVIGPENIIYRVKSGVTSTNVAPPSNDWEKVGNVTEDDVKKYAYTKNEYTPVFLNDTSNINTLRINGVTITGATVKKEQIKKLDNAIKRVKIFGADPNKFLALRQFSVDPTTGVASIGISIIDDPENDFNLTDAPLAFLSKTITDLTKPVEFKIVIQYRTEVIFITLDFSGYAEAVSMNFRDVNQIGSFKNSGIKKVENIGTKSIWGTGFKFANTGVGTTWQYPYTMYFEQAVKFISVRSQENNLVGISGVSYNTTNNFLAVVIMVCDDDDPNNLNINTSRNGFKYLRINIPITDTGVKKYTSYVLGSGVLSTVEVTLVVDLDFLFSNVPPILEKGFVISRVGELALYIVTPTRGGGGGSLNTLSLLSGPADFQGNHRFVNTSYNWSYNASANMTKLIGLPQGAQSITIQATLDGIYYNVLLLDKNLKAIRWAYDGAEGVINNLIIDELDEVAFLLVSTQDNPANVKVTAFGTFTINESIKDYRNIHAGLCDKYSGQVFKVGSNYFKKLKEGLCTLDEYELIGDNLVDLLPTFTASELIVPQNITHTDGVTKYSGGSLCAAKDGVLYFYNARSCAIYKSKDNGVTFETILDKFSQPGVFDTDDVNTEGRSAIIPTNDGELLIQVRHRGSVDIPNTTRKERYFALYKTTGGQTGLTKVLTFTHEDSNKYWLDPTDAQYNWPNHSGGCLLGDFTHGQLDNVIVMCEYGVGTSGYWFSQTPPVPNNGRGVSARAWVSLDYGLTWFKMFDGDRKKEGLEERDDNWFYFKSTDAAKTRHLHGVDVDGYRRVVHITNGDGEDYIWQISLDSLISWATSAAPVDPEENPRYKVSDTFPNWEAINIVPLKGNSFNAYSSMRAQMMKSAPVSMGSLWAHDASREYAFISYYNSANEFIFEPIKSFEIRSDFESDSAFTASWGSTDGFAQQITKIDGVTYITHTNGGERPARIFATIDGFNYKIVYEGPNENIKFATQLIKSGEDYYLTQGLSSQASNTAGYRKLAKNN